MVVFASLQERQHIAEMMDDPSLDAAAHREALTDLARINRISFGAEILWPALRKLARSHAGPLRVLDLATGRGDVPLRLRQKAQRERLEVRWSACDISPTAINEAQSNARDAGAEIAFFLHDIVNQPLSERYDVVMCSLFLHHLSEGDAVRVLRHMRAAATCLVLVNDLNRSAIGYALAWVGTRILSRSPVVHFDGPVSVQAAFTPGEARSLAEQAGLVDVRVGRRWPFRFLLTGEPG